jgi:acetyl-CoA synthetase
MTHELQRLLRPARIALIGGAWTDWVAAAGRSIGYRGDTWRVHPTRMSTADVQYFRSVDELPGSPDAAFVAAPAAEVPAIAAQLAHKKAGGFVCFASGFDETGTPEGIELTQQLILNAGTVPYTGPNCYGLVNFFDRVALWPDQVVGPPLERGVAIITQSGTLGLTLMFNHRSLPIGFLITVGNQTRITVADLIDTLSDDPRVTAFGLYLEGVKDATRFAAAIAKARAAGKPVALVKAGRTEASARAAATHTGAMTGADAVFDAFCRDAGIARCETLATLVETLKIFHLGGPLRGRRIMVIGASGGDMAMTSDVSRSLNLNFAPVTAATKQALTEILGERVTISNPFDFHTYIWFDQAKLRQLFTTLFQANYDALAFMLDCPPADRADTSAFDMPIDEFIAVAKDYPTRAAMLASLPETLYEGVRGRCLSGGVVPAQGQRETLEAFALAADVGECWQRGTMPDLILAPPVSSTVHQLTEDAAKQALHAHGLPIPSARVVDIADAATAASAIGFPVVIKAISASLAHKSDVGGVCLNIKTPEEAEAAAQRLRLLGSTILVEQMVTDSVAEVLVGITVDPQFGQVLVLGTGGVLTELLHDSTSLLPPFTPERINAALAKLKVARLLAGFRGKPAGDIPALVEAVLAITRYARAACHTLVELDVNPVIVRPKGLGVVAVDALIRLTHGD